MFISTILIDDEPLAIFELAEMLKRFPQIEVVATAQNAFEALEKINSLKPQLLFLDINMPERNGFELLQLLDNVPTVVFVTAYDQ
ncbi:MAG: LytR/AlgR family response regulator transcription factor, partial [Chitinophagaceae bacterium]